MDSAHLNPFSLEIVRMCVGHTSIAQTSETAYISLYQPIIERPQGQPLCSSTPFHEWVCSVAAFARLAGIRPAILWCTETFFGLCPKPKACGYSVVPMYSAIQKRMVSVRIIEDVSTFHGLNKPRPAEWLIFCTALMTCLNMVFMIISETHPQRLGFVERASHWASVF